MFRGTTVLASALGALIITSLAPSPVLADAPSEPVQLPVGTCINMGNSLEPPQESAWGGEPIVAEDFTRIKEAGFETIRLPVRWDNKSQSTPPYTIDPAWMDRVALAVDQALAAGLKKPAIALLLAGSALTELEQFTEAISVFERVRAVGDAAERRNADAWIDFVSEKRQLKNAVIGSR